MKLVLFDIDGTLIWPDGAGRAAMTGALTEIFGTAGPASTLPMAGKTDWQIVAELMEADGIDPAHVEKKLTACFLAIARHMKHTARQRRIRYCPGVPPLLTVLSGHPQVTLGLLTGNLATTAPIKLRAANLDPARFCVGAYGSDRLSRNLLPAVAIDRAKALTGYSFAGKNVVIIGDTPADVTCGEHLGVTAIGVATGSFSDESLDAAGADYVFPDLKDTNAVLRAIT
jgi:phosphoglycolate phosphatase-like HAD superfamily hydrolase